MRILAMVPQSGSAPNATHSGARKGCRDPGMRPSRCTLFVALWLATACAQTGSRIIVAPDGSKALYVECKESPVECLAAISNECRGGYEVLAQGSRDETLMIDKVTEAGTQVAATKFAGQGAKGIRATPSNI